MNRFPRIEPQWYRPPAVGYAEEICASASAKSPEMTTPRGQPIPIAAPPAPEVACPSELIPPDTMQMIEKEMAKLENLLILRSSSCAYPMPCRTWVSS